ncbi:MAG: DUF4350 domain-containing protein, partial [Mycobacteriales bacterium]
MSSASLDAADPLTTGEADPLTTGSDPVAPHSAAPRPSYTATADRRALLRRLRVPLALALLLIVTSFLLAANRQRVRHGEFDPASVEPRGSRALAELLTENGAGIDRVSGLQGGDVGGTVFAPFAAELPDARLRELMSPSDGVHVVLVAPYGAFQALGVKVNGSNGRGDGPRVPGCSFAPAVAAGDAHVAGLIYDVDDAADANVHTCYAGAGQPSLVHIERAASSVTIVGSGDMFTNARLDEAGNASLALALLGRDETITWVMRGRAGAAPAEEAGSLADLLPTGVVLGMLQLLVAAVVAMLWRGRRLGPVVTEPLPVIVRAAEAVEGRGRLYAAAKARGRAGWNLRRSTRARLRTRLGLPPDANHAALVDGVSARSSLRSEDVGRLLYGPDPLDDAALVRLAANLDDLDSEVR